MFKLTIENGPSVDVPADKRLVLALEDEGGIEQLHSCGGVSRCTTCRVTVLEGLASPMTAAERDKLAEKGLAELPGVRLSCQMTMTADLSVSADSRLPGSGKKDVGPRPADYIEPVPTFVQGATDPQQERPDERV